MNGKTNVQVIAVAGFIATLVMWLLGHYQPELMATAPAGLEAGLTATLIALAGSTLQHDAGIKSLPGTGTTMIAFLLVFLLSGCATRPPIKSTSDAIAVSAADIKTLAGTVKTLCGNTTPGGPCAPGALIDGEDRDRFKQHLQRANDMISAASVLLEEGHFNEAQGRLALADSILIFLRTEIARHTNEGGTTSQTTRYGPGSDWHAAGGRYQLSGSYGRAGYS